jgi:hypothetical protein
MPKSAPRRSRPTWVRKNMAMDQRKLALAQRFLGTRTETETVDAALDLLVFQAEVFAGLDTVAASGAFRSPRR